MYTRRSLLRRGSVAFGGVAGLSGLAGCTGKSAFEVFSDGVWRVFLDDATDLPAEAGVDIAIETLGDRITTEETVGFRLTTTNRDREKWLSVSSGPRCCLFNRERGGSRPESLWLYHVDDLPRKAKPDRWSADRPGDQPRSFDDYECSLRRFAAGESVENEYRLWADYRVPGYLPPGGYRFQTGLTVAESGDAAGQRYDWEFSITVDRGGG